MQLILDVLPDLLKLWKNVLPSMLLGFFLVIWFKIPFFCSVWAV